MNKRKLEKLLKLVKELSEKEELSWFKDELIKNLTGAGKLINTNQIEDYIKIDRLIINYDQIDDEKIKEQLRTDCILMYRHRLGLVVVKRDHSSISVLNEGESEMNFIQFCIHAFYQVELLINFFFKKKYRKPKENPLKNSNTTPTISDKLKVIIGILGLEYEVRNVLYKIKRIRNDFSHRNKINDWQTVDREWKKLKNELENTIDSETGIKYKFKDLMNKDKRAKNPKLAEFYSLHSDREHIKFKSKLDYNIVIESIENLKNKIIKNLKI